MNKTSFGKTGLQITGLGFGGGPIGFLNADQENAARILNQLLDGGVNCIDTAAAYHGSEELIGQAISHRRGQFVLVSKCGQKFPDLQGEAWSAAVIEQTIDRSLRRLRTDHIDVMLLHSCDLATLQKGEAVQACWRQRVEQANKIDLPGIPGDNEAAVYAATLPDIAVIETSINIADQANIDAVLPHAREKQIGVIAKRPIANAAWKPEDQQPGLYRNFSKVLFSTSGRHEADAGRTGFRWCSGQSVAGDRPALHPLPTRRERRDHRHHQSRSRGRKSGLRPTGTAARRHGPKNPRRFPPRSRTGRGEVARTYVKKGCADR